MFCGAPCAPLLRRSRQTRRKQDSKRDGSAELRFCVLLLPQTARRSGRRSPEDSEPQVSQEKMKARVSEALRVIAYRSPFSFFSGMFPTPDGVEWSDPHPSLPLRARPGAPTRPFNLSNDPPHASQTPSSFRKRRTCRSRFRHLPARGHPALGSLPLRTPTLCRRVRDRLLEAEKISRSSSAPLAYP